jgi:acyl-coenzyme A thioesterase PaaI-like protein
VTRSRTPVVFHKRPFLTCFVSLFRVSASHSPMRARGVSLRLASRFGDLARAGTSFRVPMTSTSRAVSCSTESGPPPWINTLREKFPPRFKDAPDLYWLGGDRGVGGRQVHGEDSVFGLLHGGGAFRDPLLLLDSEKQTVLLVLKTGARTAGHPGMTHGGFTSLLLDEMAGQAYCEFVQHARGPGVTANLSVDFIKSLPTESHVLVTAKVTSIDGRKVRCDVRIVDGESYYDARGEETEGEKKKKDEKDENVFAKATALFVVLAKD